MRIFNIVLIICVMVLFDAVCHFFGKIGLRRNIMKSNRLFYIGIVCVFSTLFRTITTLIGCTVKQPAPTVNVEPPEVTIEPPVVNVQPPEVTVQPAEVNVQPPQVTVQIPPGDTAPPVIISGTVSHGDVNVAVGPIKVRGVRFDFNEVVTGVVKLTDGVGVDLSTGVQTWRDGWQHWFRLWDRN